MIKSRSNVECMLLLSLTVLNVTNPAFQTLGITSNDYHETKWVYVPDFEVRLCYLHLNLVGKHVISSLRRRKNPSRVQNAYVIQSAARLS